MNKFKKNILLTFTFFILSGANSFADPIRILSPSNVLLSPSAPFVEGVDVTTKCTANYQGSDVKIDANLIVPTASLGGGNKPLVYMWIDGVASGAQAGSVYQAPSTESAQKSGVSVSFQKTLVGVSGKSNVQFSIGNAGQKSAGREINYSCANQVQAVAPTGSLAIARPNLKVLPIIAIVYHPPKEMPNPNQGPNLSLWEQRVSLGAPLVAQIEQDLSRTLPIYRILNNACPANGDAYVTLRFAIALQNNGIAPEGYIGEGYYKDVYPYQGSPEYVQGGKVLDTRGHKSAINNLPDGYEWAYFDKMIKCASDAVIEYKIDPENKLIESDETDNIIRFRISTITP